MLDLKQAMSDPAFFKVTENEYACRALQPELDSFLFPFKVHGNLYIEVLELRDS